MRSSRAGRRGAVAVLALVALLAVAVVLVGVGLGAPGTAVAQQAPGETTSSTTTTGGAAASGSSDELSERTIVRIVIGGLVGVAVGLAGATWWYVRATRPHVPEDLDRQPPG